MLAPGLLLATLGLLPLATLGLLLLATPGLLLGGMLPQIILDQPLVATRAQTMLAPTPRTPG